MCADGIKRYALGQWNAYVAAGRTRDDRRARLAEAPEQQRDMIASHVRGLFEMRKR